MNASGSSAGGLVNSTLRVIWWNGLRLLVQLGWMVALAHWLGVNQYGAFIGVASLGVAAGGFAGLGMGLKMYRDVATGSVTVAQMWGRVLGVMAWSSMGLFAAALLVADLVLDLATTFEFQVLAYLLFSEVVVAPIATQIAFAYASVGDMGRSAAVPVVLAGARLVALIMLPSGVGLHGVALAHLAATVAGVYFVVMRSGARLGVGWRVSGTSRSEVLDALSYSSLWASGLAVGSLDKSLALKWGGETAAGHYSVGQRLAAIASIPVEALSAAALPRLFRGHDAGLSDGVRIGVMASLAALYGVAAGAVVWVAAPFVVVVLGPAFSAIASLGAWMAAYVLLYCVRVVAASVLLGRGQIAWRTACEAASLVVFALLAMSLAPARGAVGAMAALVSMEAFMAALFWARILWPGRRESVSAA